MVHYCIHTQIQMFYPYPNPNENQCFHTLNYIHFGKVKVTHSGFIAICVLQGRSIFTGIKSDGNSNVFQMSPEQDMRNTYSGHISPLRILPYFEAIPYVYQLSNG